MRLLPLLPLLAVLLPLAAQRRPGSAAELEHLTFAEKQFESQALGRKVDYGIYLPKDYDDAANKATKYPLVLWLHGMWEDHRRFHGRGGAKNLDDLTGSGELPAMAFVTVNGGRSSFYVNGKTSGANEDAIARDLMTHLTKTYRIREERGARAVMGVSMGGMGAFNLALHHMDQFGTVATHSAAIFPPDINNLPPRWKRILETRAKQLGLDKIFGDPVDEELWKANNPLHQASTLAVDKLKSLNIYFDCGDIDEYEFDEPNADLHKLLHQRGVPHTWNLVQDGDHGWSYTGRMLPTSLKFVAAAFGHKSKSAKPNDAKTGGDAKPVEGNGKGEAGKEAKPAATPTRKD